MNFYNILLHLHSGGRWLVLGFLIYAMVRHFSAGSRAYNAADRRTGLLLTIFTDLQLLVGLTLYFIGPLGYKNIQNKGMAAVMKDNEGYDRFFAIEHLVMMIIAIALIHIGKAQGATALPDGKKHRRAAVYFAIALLIILAMIPWPFRALFAGRGWG